MRKGKIRWHVNEEEGEGGKRASDCNGGGELREVKMISSSSQAGWRSFGGDIKPYPRSCYCPRYK